MVLLNQEVDPTLAAVDRALEEANLRNHKPRPYIGFSEIGEPCERKIWFRYNNNATPRRIGAKGLRCIQDGFAGEDVMAARLRMVQGVDLWTEEDGKQFGVEDLDGKFGGHCDGVIKGLLQAPKTPHIWEHKQVNEKKFAELEKYKSTVGEKEALKNWDIIYYAQAVLYMYYFDLSRHYLTVATPGGRDYTSCRTEANNPMAKALRGKAERILSATRAPVGISNDPTFYKCKWCDFKDECHKKLL